MTRLYWMDTIKIMMEMLDKNPNDIATLLGVNRTTIDRLLNGESKKFTGFDKETMSEEIYARVFDPVACPLNEKEKFLWELLRETIENLHHRDVMEDLWGIADNYKKGDYKIFVTTMLERTRSNPDESISRDLSRKFKDVVEDYIFSDNNASNKPPDNHPQSEAATLIVTINEKIVEKYGKKYSENYIFQRILEFRDEIQSYIILTSPSVMDVFSAYRTHNNELDHIQRRIDDLYDQICGTE